MSLTHIAFVAGSFASVAVSVWAIVAVLRAPGLRFRLLWALLSLVGVGGAALVWNAAGEIHWFFGVALPSASFSAGSDWHPQVVRVLFPAGALAVLAALRFRRVPDGETARE